MSKIDNFILSSLIIKDGFVSNGNGVDISINEFVLQNYFRFNGHNHRLYVIEQIDFISTDYLKKRVDKLLLDTVDLCEKIIDKLQKRIHLLSGDELILLSKCQKHLYSLSVIKNKLIQFDAVVLSDKVKVIRLYCRYYDKILKLIYNTH